VMPPRCPRCNGWIRPSVVWFGEPLPQDSWQLAVQGAKTCDVFFSIGTSSLVYPAATLPQKASKRGACVIQVNPMQTQLDMDATYNLHGKAGEVMTALLTATLGQTQVTTPMNINGTTN
jgi:NAD-dependent deacetylase